MGCDVFNHSCTAELNKNYKHVRELITWKISIQNRLSPVTNVCIILIKSWERLLIHFINCIFIVEICNKDKHRVWYYNYILDKSSVKSSAE